MNTHTDFTRRLKWLTFFRVLFTSLLLGSTIILQLTETSSPLADPLIGLYGLIAGIFILSFLYTLILKIFFMPDSETGRKKLTGLTAFAYIQIITDTFVVSLIIFMTGGFFSVFLFLYLVVIIYASMLLFRRGSMIIAALCTIQYGVMIDLEFYGLITPLGIDDTLARINYPWSHVIYKIIMILMACCAVSFLSSLLSEQERKTKKVLLAMEDNMKHFEKMAAVGEMAAGLAHEIKNPLASLRGAIQMLREYISYEPDHDKLMRIVLREADRLSTLVNDFLLFARPPVGRSSAFEIDRAITELIVLFEKDRACCGKIKITQKIASGIRVEMDPIHFRQILWNLLLNAAEAISDSGEILVEMYPLRNRYVFIKIADSGCGMSKETIKSVFDPFFTTKSNGTGLGLSIVRRIVESYPESRIDVESELGMGTTFTLKMKIRLQ
jgi:two-component system sensor histidine kinase PilS (NtrC family)